VIAWLGHIASLPEGSQYDDFVILSPQGTGEFGLTGATQEIEAEIRTLRDAYQVPPAESAEIIRALVEDTYDLVEGHLPQVDVDRLRHIFRYQRTFLDEMPEL
jgi:hypothetical protein